MSAAATSSRVRRFVVAGIGFLVVWQIGILANIPRSTEVTLGLFGFVLHVLFGKAFALVPAYFDADLQLPEAPAVQLPLTVVGTGALGLGSVPGGSPSLSTIGALLWTLGVGLFLLAMVWSIHDNMWGRTRETATRKPSRRELDRLANLGIPIALAYLAVGTYAIMAPTVGLPPLIDGYRPRATHLLAAGTATVFVLGVGFRLLPRFFVASPPARLPSVVLACGALGPGLLATTLGRGWPFAAAAILEAAAVGGFAVIVFALYRRSDRARVSFYGIVAGAVYGSLGVLLGLSFAFHRVSARLATAHVRTNLLGFLGLTIVGVTYQLYPPGDRTISRGRGSDGRRLHRRTCGWPPRDDRRA